MLMSVGDAAAYSVCIKASQQNIMPTCMHDAR